MKKKKHDDIIITHSLCNSKSSLSTTFFSHKMIFLLLSHLPCFRCTKNRKITFCNHLLFLDISQNGCHFYMKKNGRWCHICLFHFLPQVCSHLLQRVNFNSSCAVFLICMMNECPLNCPSSSWLHDEQVRALIIVLKTD